MTKNMDATREAPPGTVLNSREEVLPPLVATLCFLYGALKTS